VATQRRGTPVRQPSTHATTQRPHPRLAWYTGLAVMAVLEVIEWPLAIVLVLGHEIAHRAHSEALRDFAEGVERGHSVVWIHPDVVAEVSYPSSDGFTSAKARPQSPQMRRWARGSSLYGARLLVIHAAMRPRSRPAATTTAAKPMRPNPKR